MILTLFILAGVYAKESIIVSSTEQLGKCNCDITLNSCDSNCCCDTNCASSILTFWGSNCIQGTSATVSDICTNSQDSLEAG